MSQTNTTQTTQAATATRKQELIINLTNLQQHVTIIGPNKEKTSVNIMPKRRVELTEGWTACSNWQAVNPKTIKVHKATVDVPTKSTADSKTTVKQVADTPNTTNTSTKVKE